MADPTHIYIYIYVIQILINMYIRVVYMLMGDLIHIVS